MKKFKKITDRFFNFWANRSHKARLAPHIVLVVIALANIAVALFGITPLTAPISIGVMTFSILFSLLDRKARTAKTANESQKSATGETTELTADELKIKEMNIKLAENQEHSYGKLDDETRSVVESLFNVNGKNNSDHTPQEQELDQVTNEKTANGNFKNIFN